jgi:dihydroflavonol-4-reductase
MRNELVLVTGGTGFIGAHCIVQLLAQGYRVRTTVRRLSREAALRAMLLQAGISTAQADSVSYVAADLLADDGWAEAMVGCDYVLHVASPFPATEPKDPDELIRPAREGSLRVLRAARDAGVKRVVLTSSFAAIGYGLIRAKDHLYTEQDWTDADAPAISVYTRSKTLAERAAWDFIQHEGGALQLTTVNPVGVFGPTLGSDYSSSIILLQGLLTGKIRAIPQISTSTVDVRDVADLHLRAMIHPEAAGERFLAVAGEPMTIAEITALLRTHMGAAARKAPRRVLPNWLVRVAAKVKPDLKSVVPLLGVSKRISHAKAEQMLDWTPRGNHEALLASAHSLVKQTPA